MNMGDQSISLRHFLEARQLTQRDASQLAAQTRSRLERSVLLEKIDGICAEVNREAGAAVIEAHAYLPPEHVVRSFTFVKAQIEYVMRLDLWGTKPALVFLVRKWRDTSSSAWVRWFWRTVQVDPLTVEIKLAGEIQEDRVSERDVQEWFFYLLSGLDRSYMPTLKRRTGEGANEQ